MLLVARRSQGQVTALIQCPVNGFPLPPSLFIYSSSPPFAQIFGGLLCSPLALGALGGRCWGGEMTSSKPKLFRSYCKLQTSLNMPVVLSLTLRAACVSKHCFTG